MALPCPFKPQSKPTIRPPWFFSGSVVVGDPVFGNVPLVLSPAPLKSWKSATLPDNSYWMWLATDHYRAVESPLSGVLFFALSWEYWKILGFVSYDKNYGSSVWSGSTGNGRMNGGQVTITVQPRSP